MRLFYRGREERGAATTAPDAGASPHWLAESGTPDNPHAHLDPIVAAERAWGNRGSRGWESNPLAEWNYYLSNPFHVDLLRSHFVFPLGIRLHPSGPRRDLIKWLVLGGGDRVYITAPVPRDWSGGWEPLPLPRPADVIADKQDG